MYQPGFAVYITLAGMTKGRQFVCVFALALLPLGCSLERPEVSYKNFADAEQHGAIERGWIPNWIPGSATDIRELHDLDTNESMMAFELPPGAAWDLPSNCVKVSYNEVQPPRFRSSWWPSAKEQKSAYDFHRCAGDDPHESKDQWVARHKSGKRGLHWRAYAR